MKEITAITQGLILSRRECANHSRHRRDIGGDRDDLLMLCEKISLHVDQSVKLLTSSLKAPVCAEPFDDALSANRACAGCRHDTAYNVRRPLPAAWLMYWLSASAKGDVRIKDKETPVGDERLGRIIRRKINEPGQGHFKTGRSSERKSRTFLSQTPYTDCATFIPVSTSTTEQRFGLCFTVRVATTQDYFCSSSVGAKNLYLKLNLLSITK